MNKKERKTNANIVEVASLGDLTFEKPTQNKITPKNNSNLISNLQPLNSYYSQLTSHTGITLIALVITIIVMLILVGVTVTMALNGGLFNQAKRAVSDTQNAVDKENELSTGRVQIGDTWYDSLEDYADGKKSANQEKTTVTVDDYGKYVKYGVDLNGDNNLENDWRIFYVDKNGYVFIIADDYVRGDVEGCNEVYQSIQNSEMVENTTTGYEDFCFYWNPNAPEYHCYDGYNTTITNENTISQKQCSYPTEFMATKYYCSDHVGTDGKGGNPNSRYASALLCTNNWSPLVKYDEGAIYAVGGPTLEMWVESWNQKYGQSIDSENGITLFANGNDNDISKYGYSVGITEDATGTVYSIKNCTNGYNDTLYFPHQTYQNLNLDGEETEDDNCYGYWLATPSASNVYHMMYVNYDGKVTNNDFQDGYCCSVRPLVCLKSEVVLAQTQQK